MFEAHIQRLFDLSERHIIAQKTHNSHDINPLQQVYPVAIADNYIATGADQLKA
jgi:hypothetical protein